MDNFGHFIEEQYKLFKQIIPYLCSLSSLIMNIIYIILLNRLNVPETGHYRVCFDNSYSHFTPKKVAFSVKATSPEDKAQWEEYQVTYIPEATYDLQVSEIKVTNLNNSSHFRTYLLISF